MIIGNLTSKSNNSKLVLCNQSNHFVSDRKYTDKHEWVQLDGKIGTIGITNYAQVR
jgi:glycine cleavage system H protein